MRDDNPLWYDYTEQDEPPGRGILILAGLFGAAASLTTATGRVIGWSVERCRLTTAHTAMGRMARGGRRR